MANDLVDRCKTCGSQLVIDTDGNGQCIDWCPTCDHQKQRNALKPEAARLGLDTSEPLEVEREFQQLFADGTIDDDLDGLGSWERDR